MDYRYIKESYLTCTGIIAVRRGIRKKMPEGWKKILSISSPNACLLYSDVFVFILILFFRFISFVHFTGAMVFSFSLGEKLCVWTKREESNQRYLGSFVMLVNELKHGKNQGTVKACMTSENMSGNMPLPADRPAIISKVYLKFDGFPVGHFANALVQLFSSSQMQPLWYDDNSIIHFCIFISKSGKQKTLFQVNKRSCWSLFASS